MPVRLWLPSLAVLLIFPTQLPAQESTQVWERIVVIGASASAGFGVSGISLDGEGDVPLSELCEAMILKKHEPVTNLSDRLFFMTPGETGSDQVAKALEEKPSAVLAVDFLFWYGYGVKDDEARIKDIDAGLKLLEGFSCPVVISRLPEMSDAVGLMLSKEQVPSKESLKKLNERIDSWIRGHKNVLVIPLSEMLEAAKTGNPVKAGKSEWKRDALQSLLQRDRLHPTLEGLGMIAGLSFEALQKRCKIPTSVFNLDIKKAAATVAQKRPQEDRSPRE